MKKDVEQLPEYLTIREVAAILRVSPLTIKRWGKVGSFVPAIRINTRGDRRYRRDQLIVYLGRSPSLEEINKA